MQDMDIPWGGILNEVYVYLKNWIDNSLEKNKASNSNTFTSEFYQLLRRNNTNSP